MTLRARIEGAVQAEQHARAAQHFHAHVKTSLEHLVAAIQVIPHMLATTPTLFDETEKSEDLSYWTKPELPRVVSALCELERLAKERAATLIARAGESSKNVDVAKAEGEEEEQVRQQSSLFTALVGHLIAELLFPVMTAYQAIFSAIPTSASAQSSGSTACVQVQLSATACDGLFAPDSALQLPVCVYVGWRCAFRLLDTFRRLLSLREDGDGGAGWVDVASAMLDSLNRAAQGLSTVGPQRTCVEAPIAHLYWWWWSFTHAFGVAHELIEVKAPPTTSLPSSLTPAISDGPSSVSSAPLQVDYTQLWCTGRTCATRYLCGVVLPTAAESLQRSMSALIFQVDFSAFASGEGAGAGTARSVSTSSNAHGLVQTRMQSFTDALSAVLQCAHDVFPHVQKPQQKAKAQLARAADSSSELHSAAVTMNSAKADQIDAAAAPAAAGFVQLVVHEALRPFAERVLDDPSLLMQHTRPFVPDHTVTAAGATSSLAVPPPPSHIVGRDSGWAESDDEESEWEEVRVMGSANASLSPNVSSHHLETEKGSPAESSTVASTPQPAPTKPIVLTNATAAVVKVTSAHDALLFVLDTLEAQCGGAAVRQDAIAMTLRRLL